MMHLHLKSIPLFKYGNVASYCLFPNHYGLNYKDRIEKEVGEIRKLADSKIKDIEERHAEKEKSLKMLAEESAKEAKITVEKKNRLREEQKRKALESARLEERKRIHTIQKRLVGWSEAEVQEICRNVDSLEAIQPNLQEWLKWMCARIDGFLIQAVATNKNLIENQKSIFKPNNTYLQNMNDYRLNGQMGTYLFMEKSIEEGQREYESYKRKIETVGSLQEQVQQRLEYYLELQKAPNLLDCIIQERKTQITPEFESWINQRRIDESGNLIQIQNKKSWLNRLLPRFYAKTDFQQETFDSLERYLSSLLLQN